MTESIQEQLKRLQDVHDRLGRDLADLRKKIEEPTLRTPEQVADAMVSANRLDGERGGAIRAHDNYMRWMPIPDETVAYARDYITQAIRDRDEYWRQVIATKLTGGAA